MIRRLVEETAESVAWIESMGMKFKPKLHQVHGSLYPRGNALFGPLGSDCIEVLGKRCQAHGISVENNAKVVRVVREKPLSGRVLGVGYEQEDRNVFAEAKKAATVAAGGFGVNQGVRALHDPRMAGLIATNHVGATGDLIPLLCDIGAGLTGTDFIQCNPGWPRSLPPRADSPRRVLHHR